MTEPAFSTFLAALFVAAPFHTPHLLGMALTAIGLFVILNPTGPRPQHVSVPIKPATV